MTFEEWLASVDETVPPTLETFDEWCRAAWNAATAAEREHHEKQLRALVEKWRRQEREREIESARINQRLLAGETITVESKTSSCLNADLLACADELEAALAQTTSHNK